MSASDAQPVRIEDLLKHREWVTALTRKKVTSIRYLDRELGEGEVAFAALSGYIPAQDEAVRKHAVLIHVVGDVPFQDVLRVVERQPKSYDEHLAGRLSSRLAGLMQADGNALAKGTVAELEARFVPKEEDRNRVRELLGRMEVGDSTLIELKKKVRPSASVVLGLLERSPVRAEILRLAAEVEAELVKHE